MPKILLRFSYVLLLGGFVMRCLDITSTMSTPAVNGETSSRICRATTLLPSNPVIFVRCCLFRVRHCKITIELERIRTCHLSSQLQTFNSSQVILAYFVHHLEMILRPISHLQKHYVPQGTSIPKLAIIPR
jgi:hypothetical protein